LDRAIAYTRIELVAGLDRKKGRVEVGGEEAGFRAGSQVERDLHEVELARLVNPQLERDVIQFGRAGELVVRAGVELSEIDRARQDAPDDGQPGRPASRPDRISPKGAGSEVAVIRLSD